MGALTFGAYNFASAKTLRKDIGRNEFLNALQIWEALAKNPKWEFRALSVWARDSDLQERTISRLVEALEKSQTERGENNSFIAVERNGERIRFFSEDLVNSFRKREKEAERKAKEREKNKKDSESFPKTTESFSEISENFGETFESLGEVFENASPQSPCLSGNTETCPQDVRAHIIEYNRIGDNRIGNNIIGEYLCGERERGEGGETNPPGDRTTSLNGVSDETLKNVQKFKDLYPKSVDFGKALKIWQDNNLDESAGDIFATIEDNLEIGGKWHSAGQKRYIPNFENFLTGESASFDWQTRKAFFNEQND